MISHRNGGRVGWFNMKLARNLQPTKESAMFMPLFMLFSDPDGLKFVDLGDAGRAIFGAGANLF
ncbi:hypothetical protein GCM10010112_06820 [Actinoplanes lobatus]|uniref:Uncharacterized protein n=2 Tax=Actinoplanes lobatus TaxID=113568 RepID=A0ABQ4AEU4_9ACTN|nr:hypothetical protein GCM10010112_06820 [Actinoplanes lobatus]GIE39330.1 hypothetical protein Alo02nite_22280 [Actinoplanes lobatus]